eukprot:9783145-Heterocapsa_arctica.AAC.1
MPVRAPPIPPPASPPPKAAGVGNETSESRALQMAVNEAASSARARSANEPEVTYTPDFVAAAQRAVIAGAGTGT